MSGHAQEVDDRVWVLHHPWFELNTTVVAGALGAVVVDTRGSAAAAHERATRWHVAEPPAAGLAGAAI